MACQASEKQLASLLAHAFFTQGRILLLSLYVRNGSSSSIGVNPTTGVFVSVTQTVDPSSALFSLLIVAPSLKLLS